MKIKVADIKILLHTLGLDATYIQPFSYRNYFVANTDHADMPSLARLCEAGMMEERTPPSFLERGDRVFVATASGKIIAHKKRKRLTKAALRYRRYLNISDSFPNLTFKQFLTHPYFKDAR